MYRMTGDPIYQEWGWEIFNVRHMSFAHVSRVCVCVRVCAAHVSADAFLVRSRSSLLAR
jgi:hypothetical protein